MPNLTYPVLCFSSGSVNVCFDFKQLVSANRLGLKSGYFDDLLIVDSNLVAHKVRGATKLRGRGFLRGWGTFLNQKIEVKLNFEEPAFSVRLDEIKDRTLRIVEVQHGWETRGDFDWLKMAVQNATSVREIVSAIYHGQPVEESFQQDGRDDSGSGVKHSAEP